jgi:hypothetical protein
MLLTGAFQLSTVMYTCGNAKLVILLKVKDSLTVLEKSRFYKWGVWTDFTSGVLNYCS